MLSEKQVQKFHSDDMSYPDLGSASDWSCYVGNLLQPTRSTTQIWVVTRHQYGISALIFSDDILWGNQRWHHKVSAVFSGKCSMKQLKLTIAFSKWENQVLVLSQQCVYDIEDITWPRVDTKFLFECWKIFHKWVQRTSEIFFQHEKRNFVSPSGHVMFFLLYKHQWNTKPFHFNSFLVWKARFII